MITLYDPRPRFEPQPILPKLSYPVIDYTMKVTAPDLAKFSRVEKWARIDNPCVGTCRCCGYRGLVDDVIVGLYRARRLT